MPHVLTTPRLKLRPLRRADAPRIQALCGNWNVARMLESVPYPYPDGLAESWIAERPAAERRGAAYSFAIELAGELIGVIGIERRGSGDHALGYWLGEPWWGKGFMSEAVAAVVRFAREELGLETLYSAYLADNPASGRVQQKSGFHVIGHGRLGCRARGAEVEATFTELRLAQGVLGSTAP